MTPRAVIPRNEALAEVTWESQQGAIVHVSFYASPQIVTSSFQDYWILPISLEGLTMTPLGRAFLDWHFTNKARA